MFSSLVAVLLGEGKNNIQKYLSSPSLSVPAVNLILLSVQFSRSIVSNSL